MLENLKKEYLVHEKQRIEKCEFLRSMLENEKDLEEEEVKEFMEDVEKMNKEREKRKIDLKAIEHIKMLMDELFTKKDTQSFLNFIQLHSKSLEASAAAGTTENGSGLNAVNGNGGRVHSQYNGCVNNQGCVPQGQNQGAQCKGMLPQNMSPHSGMHPGVQQQNPQPGNLTAAQLQQQHEAQVRKVLRSGCPSQKNRSVAAGKTTVCTCGNAHHH